MEQAVSATSVKMANLARMFYRILDPCPSLLWVAYLQSCGNYVKDFVEDDEVRWWC